MSKFVIAGFLALVLPIGAASAFQVLTPEQMQEGGMGLTEGYYFSPQQMQQQDLQFGFVANDRMRRYNRSSSERNFYGNVDGGGRYYGDSRGSTFKGCDYAQSNAGKLDAMSGRGFAYPCQRFR